MVTKIELCSFGSIIIHGGIWIAIEYVWDLIDKIAGYDTLGAYESALQGQAVVCCFVQSQLGYVAITLFRSVVADVAVSFLCRKVCCIVCTGAVLFSFY